MIKNTTKKAFEEVMNEYKTLSVFMQNMVRNTAVLELEEEGAPVIGSSDINYQIVDLYNIYGDFDEIIRHGMKLVREPKNLLILIV